MGVWSIRRGLAILSLMLYCFDQGSDIFVGVDLIIKCHVRYGLSVFCFVLLPGLVWGGVQYFYMKKIGLLKLLIFPIWFIPHSVKKLFDAIVHSTKSGQESSMAEDDAKSIKIMELCFEAYPQFILGTYIVIGLQIAQPLNYFSCSVSATSAIFGLGDMLAFTSNGDAAGYPFLLTVKGVLATVIDSLFRAFFLSYFLSIFKAYGLLLPTIYVILFELLCCFKGRCNHEIDFLEILNTFLSFCSSANNYMFDTRLISKIAFALIFLPSFCLLTYQTSTHPNTVIVIEPKNNMTNTISDSDMFENTTLDTQFDQMDAMNTTDLDLNDVNSTSYNDEISEMKNTTVVTKFDPSECLSICPTGNETSIDSDLQEYCGSLWKYNMGDPVTIIESLNIALPQTHLKFLSILLGLFVLSTLEGVIENFVSFSPYRLL